MSPLSDPTRRSPSHLDALTGSLRPSVLLLMSIAAGLCAGGNYINQPLLHSIALGLGISEATAAFTVTLAQVSYACGLLLLVPLGDKLERRSLVVSLMLMAALGQFTSGFATGMGMLTLGTIMAGLFSVAAQILVPMAAMLSDPQRSGRAVGLVMSGLLVGILTARSVAGLLSGLGDWSTTYKVAGLAMLVVAAALWFMLPASRAATPASYGQVLRSMLTLVAQEPRLRSRAVLGALAFATLSALFSTMALLLSGPAHGLSDTAIGLVGLVGVAGALMANLAGRLGDRGWTQATTAVSVFLLVPGWLCLWLGGSSLAWFLVGILVVDLALQGVHISNQNVIYALSADARSRLNAVYMTTYFIGGASGSALGSLAWQQGGWPATCALGVGLASLTGVALLFDEQLARRQRRSGLTTALR